ncbi:MAG: STAS domain-containing protein [Clostridia bacterium]|nr:STAS domain-containing protein [Clostridia bacterium]
MENLTVKREGDLLSVSLKNRLDATNSSSVQEALEPQLKGVQHLRLDLSDLNYISSAGLRVLLFLLQEMQNRNGDMELHHVNQMVMDIFDVTGLLEDMPIV